MAILPALATTATHQSRLVPFTKPPSSTTFLVEDGPREDGGGRKSRDKGKAKEASDGGQEGAESPWRDADFLLSRPFNLHRLTPLHAFPDPDSASGPASCRDLRAFLRRRLEDLVSTDPSSDASQLVLRNVSFGHVGLDGLPGVVGYEVEFSTAAQSEDPPVRTARFIFLPFGPDVAAAAAEEDRLPDGFSAFPLALVNAPTPRLEKDFLDWVEGRFDCKATRTDAATGGAFAPSRLAIHSIIQAAAEAYFSDLPPARETSLHFKLPGRPTFKLHFPPDGTDLLIRTARSSSEHSSATGGSYVLDHLFSRFAVQTSIPLARFNLVRVILGDVQLDQAAGAEPRLRFFKGADEAKVVVRALKALASDGVHY